MQIQCLFETTCGCVEGREGKGREGKGRENEGKERKGREREGNTSSDERERKQEGKNLFRKKKQ